jgi:ribosomal protein S18 acetylase RimI-like enzyme
MSTEVSNIELREATSADEPFLFEVYASTRSDDLEGLGWDENQKLTFIKMQFLARERSYPKVDNRIILFNGRAVGRVLVDRTDAAILLIDIALLKEYRNAGIGSSVINELIKESSDSQKALKLHVLNASPALRLYERLGFCKTGNDQVYSEMTWMPSLPRAEE